MQISNNTILITGGATGIGLGLARQFVKEGNRVIICGRRQEALNEAASQVPGLITYQCDISTAEGRLELFNWIKANHPATNVLINNAGIQQWTKIEDDDFYERIKTEIAINAEAPVHLASLFAKWPSITAIINVTSGLSFSPLTKVPVYCATKAFLHSFTLSLRHLLAAKGIEVIEIIPPALNTDLGGKGLHDFAPAVSGFVESVFEQLKAGKTSITYGTSEFMLHAGPAELQGVFEKMNSN